MIIKWTGLHTVNIPKDAVEDYVYLIDRGYKQKSSLELIGSRFLLDSYKRQLIFRSVQPASICRKIWPRIITDIHGRSVIIDCYNVINTVIGAEESLAVISRDSLLRDAQEVHSSFKMGPKVIYTVMKIIQYLKYQKTGHAMFVLDSQISRSGELAAKIREILSSEGMDGDALVRRDADKFIKEELQGDEDLIIASSDTGILIYTTNEIHDMARGVVEFGNI